MDRSVIQKNKKTYETWRTIIDLIGDGSLWPINIKRIFLAKYLNNIQRVLLCIFCYVNGLSPDVILELNNCIQIFRDNSAIQHFMFVHSALEEGRYRYFYAYNIHNNKL